MNVCTTVRFSIGGAGEARDVGLDGAPGVGSDEAGAHGERQEDEAPNAAVPAHVSLIPTRATPKSTNRRARAGEQAAIFRAELLTLRETGR